MKRIHIRKRRVARVSGELLLFLAFVGVVVTYFTNPFTSLTWVAKPYETTITPNGQLALVSLSHLQPRTAPLYRSMAWITSGINIVENVYAGGKKAPNTEVERIIDDIHTLRFNPNNPYLISGDHFNQLYVRSLGIFYASLLDPRTARSKEDWLNRESIYLKTTAYALDVISRTKSFPTTIVPLGGNAVTTVNIYHPASDTLYSLLYALRVMTTSQELQTMYPFSSDSPATLDTEEAATDLLNRYHQNLAELFSLYKTMVYENSSGLVRKDILLSGAKDVMKRQSSFYDNVIFWKTNELAQDLQIVPRDDAFLQNLKSRIVAAFWLPDEGHFLEDLSDEGKKGKWYSSDWLIVLMTGFLDPKNPSERPYFEKNIAYIKSHHLDEPFGLRYQERNRAFRQYLLPRLFATAYGGTAIWSNWGMEYIKLLAILFGETGNETYRTDAQKQLDAYTKNMVTYRGYPEVYATGGAMFLRPLYKSVRQTGWVVSFEEARALLDFVTRSPMMGAS